MNTCLFAKTERDLLSRMGIIMNDILGKLFIEKEEYKFPIVFRSDNFKDELSCLLDSYVNDLKQFYAAKCVVDGVDKFRKLCVYRAVATVTTATAIVSALSSFSFRDATI